LINKTSDIHGKFEEGSICCDNESCQKVLYQWYDEDDAPDEDRAGFFAYSVMTRILFNRFPTNSAMASINPTYVFSTQGRYVGYILDFDVLPLKLDFCSADCSTAWIINNKKEVLGIDFQPLKEKKSYSIILYGKNPQDQVQLVADNDSRFETIAIGNFLPTTAPQNQAKAPVGQKINIVGKFFDVRKSNVLIGGQKEPPLGLVMTTLTLKCPMKLNSSAQTCGQTIHIIVDFAPSVWICPKCNGIIVLDKPQNGFKHARANLTGNISAGSTNIIVNYYFSKLDWGNKIFLNWIRNEIDTEMILVADAYQDSGMFGNTIISNSLVNLDDVVNLFGQLMA